MTTTTTTTLTPRHAVARACLCACACVAAWLGTACPPAPPDDDDGPIASLSPEQHLVRIAMALRGVRPSDDELDRVARDPSELDTIVDEYLDTPELAATVREMHAEQLLLNVDPVFFPAGFRPLGPLADLDAQALNLRVTESAARLVEHVVMNDRPYHEILTADYTVTDAVNAAIFGIPYNPAGDEWQVTHFDDGREHAGILSDSFLYTRHSSTFSNKNRGRANVVAKALLCYDFLSREVELDSSIDLADEEAVAHAIVENPKCQSCHQSLDPLAASFSPFFPIYVPTFLEQYPFALFTGPSTSYMQVADPALFGTPTHGVRDLGIVMAADPRFSLCTARRFLSYLEMEPLEEIDLEKVSAMSDVFLASGMSAKALIKAIVLSDDFRASHATIDDSDPHAMLKTRPEQLARFVEQATGYRWTTDLPFDFGTGNIGQVDLMTDAFFGFKVLAGGTDGQGVARPSSTTNATSALTLRALAAHAAPFVVSADFDRPKAQRRLFTAIDDVGDDGEAAARAQLVVLERRLFGERHAVDDDEIDDGYALFRDALAHNGGDGKAAWQLVVYAFLQDARVAYH